MSVVLNIFEQVYRSNLEFNCQCHICKRSFISDQSILGKSNYTTVERRIQPMLSLLPRQSRTWMKCQLTSYKMIDQKREIWMSSRQMYVYRQNLRSLISNRLLMQYLKLKVVHWRKNIFFAQWGCREKLYPRDDEINP